MRLACLAAVLACLGPAEARACTVPFIPTFDNQTVDGSMTVRSGQRCYMWLQRSPGPMTSVVIVNRPANGTLSTAGQRIVYASRPGFVGRDSFTYARHGRDRYGNRSVKTVRVAVTVQ